jgi:hypothetical protein
LRVLARPRELNLKRIGREVSSVHAPLKSVAPSLRRPKL